MIDLLRDPAWQFVGIVITSALAIWVYRAQRTRRELSFGLLSARTLVTVHNSLSSRVEVTLDGQRVENASLLVFGLKNSGNVPLRPGDFQRPLLFRFGSSVKLLSVEITRKSPANLDATLNIVGDTATLSPLLINPGEHLVLQALVAGHEQTVSCDARLEGVSTLSTLHRGSSPEPKSFYRRVGSVVLGLPLQIILVWFIVNLADVALGMRLTELFTVNGSLAFGVFSVALVTRAFEEVASALRAKLLPMGARALDDA